MMPTQKLDSMINANKPSRQNTRGFTLVEMLVTVLLLSLLMSMAVPSFREATLSSQLTSFANDFVASTVLSRSEAIKRNSQVTLCATTCATSATTCTCATSGGWEQGWVVLADIDLDGSIDDVVSRHAALKTGLKMTDASNTRSMTFEPSGVGSTQVTMTLCRNSPSAGTNERVITVSATGRASVSKTTTGSCP